MSTPFMGELRIVSFNFAPKGWALANGQLLPIQQNQALFSLFGTTYGGNGTTNFALPDYRGRTPVHMGNGFTQGERAGSEAVTVNIQQLPTHNHFLMASTAVGNVVNPVTGVVGNVLASDPGSCYFPTANAAGTFSATTIGAVGGNQAHNNMAPYLVLNFIVALQGIFPSQN